MGPFFYFIFPTWMLHIGAADPATHKIYIWDISNDGQFASALDGGREPLIDVHVSCSPTLYNSILIHSVCCTVAPFCSTPCLDYQPRHYSHLA
jgi:hypothetical protein